MLPKLVIVALLVTGGLFASRPIHLRGRRVVLTAFIGFALEALWIVALANTRLESRLHELVYASSLGLFVAAAIETVGLWMPLIAIPWASWWARATASLAVYAACVFAASGYYFPFDIVEINGVVASPSRIEYFLVTLALLPVAGLGHLLGRLARRGRSSATTA